MINRTTHTLELNSSSDQSCSSRELHSSSNEQSSGEYKSSFNEQHHSYSKHHSSSNVQHISIYHHISSYTRHVSLKSDCITKGHRTNGIKSNHHSPTDLFIHWIHSGGDTGLRWLLASCLSAVTDTYKPIFHGDPETHKDSFHDLLHSLDKDSLTLKLDLFPSIVLNM